jgi:hypothetical protein
MRENEKTEKIKRQSKFIGVQMALVPVSHSYSYSYSLFERLKNEQEYE